MKFGRRGRGRGREPIWTRREPTRPDESNVIELSVEGSSAPAVDGGGNGGDASLLLGADARPVELDYSNAQRRGKWGDIAGGSWP